MTVWNFVFLLRLRQRAGESSNDPTMVNLTNSLADLQQLDAS